jgi:prepilin-type N-terminal cleavage/methylation domain-containing protein
MSRTSTTRASGFTLIELLVAVGLLAIVFIGILNMLDTSTTVSKVEGALADTQENVRFAAYHIMRTVRMTGGGEMPFARDDGTWLCGRLQNNQTGAVTTDLGTAQVAAGTVGARRSTVLGRTPFDGRNLSGAGSGWQEPVATFQIDGDPALNASLFNRGAKWRRMDVTAGLRNFTL